MIAYLTSEGGAIIEPVTSAMMEKVLDAIPQLFNLAGKCMEQIFENEVLTLFFSVSMVGIGLGIFRKLKRTARA